MVTEVKDNTVPKNVCGHMRFERHLLSVFSLQFQRTRCRSPAHYPLRAPFALLAAAIGGPAWPRSR